MQQGRGGAGGSGATRGATDACVLPSLSSMPLFLTKPVHTMSLPPACKMRLRTGCREAVICKSINQSITFKVHGEPAEVSWDCKALRARRAGRQ